MDPITLPLGGSWVILRSFLGLFPILKFLLDSDLGVPDPGRALVLLGGDGDLVGILDGGGGDSWDEKNLKPKTLSTRMVIF